MGGASGTLRIRDLVFPVREATLSGWLGLPPQSGNGGLSWTLDIRCEEVEVLDDDWKPRLYYEGFTAVGAGWKDLAGLRLAWSPDAVRPDDGPCAMYIWEHGAIPRATLEIGPRDGDRFRVCWEGRCEIFYNEDYMDDVPFSAETWARFSHISVLGDFDQGVDQLSQRLAVQTDMTDLRPGPLRPFGQATRRAGLMGIVDRLRPPRTRNVIDFTPDV